MASENWLIKLRPKLKISTIRWSNEVDGSTYKKNKLESFLLGSTDKSANKVFFGYWLLRTHMGKQQHIPD